ncbi:unnamed protein product, partial [Amoebophrya sp. A25]|eukprot:GSA25T00026766001.1
MQGFIDLLRVKFPGLRVNAPCDGKTQQNMQTSAGVEEDAAEGGEGVRTRVDGSVLDEQAKQSGGHHGVRSYLITGHNWGGTLSELMDTTRKIVEGNHPDKSLRTKKPSAGHPVIRELVGREEFGTKTYRKHWHLAITCASRFRWGAYRSLLAKAGFDCNFKELKFANSVFYISQPTRSKGAHLFGEIAHYVKPGCVR